jgi:hypothetical protein
MEFPSLDYIWSFQVWAALRDLSQKTKQNKKPCHLQDSEVGGG